jgi:glyoxylase-like metal-dependent hydrolase (beta-lactamase superfamily II)
MRIRQSQGASPVLDLAVAEVRVDEPVDIAVPDSVRHARENVVVTREVAEGVWFLAGGSHNSVAIEQSAQIVLVESPLHDGRALAVMAAANQLVPGKRVQTVINSHHHFDHAGGLRCGSGRGRAPDHQRAGQALLRARVRQPQPHRPRPPGADRCPGAHHRHQRQSTVLRDGSRAVEIHEMQGSLHAVGFLMVWLPAEKLLIQADAYTPGPPGSPPPPAPNANHLNLVQNIERLGLRPQTLLPLHGRVVPMAELLAIRSAAERRARAPGRPLSLLRARSTRRSPPAPPAGPARARRPCSRRGLGQRVDALEELRQRQAAARPVVQALLAVLQPARLLGGVQRVGKLRAR